ncbi:hypothetical protein MBH78_13065 [Oceanimonas sp. NS1]|nr:hypothetical protein [Oceanimonas sp. NS1]
MTEAQLLQKVHDCGLPFELAKALLRDDETAPLVRTSLFVAAQQAAGESK